VKLIITSYVTFTANSEYRYLIPHSDSTKRQVTLTHVTLVDAILTLAFLKSSSQSNVLKHFSKVKHFLETQSSDFSMFRCGDETKRITERDTTALWTVHWLG